jgi:hypothetical protein
VTSKVFELTRAQFLALLAGDEGLKQRLAAGERMRIETPFVYPARLGSVMIYLGPRPPADVEAGPDPVSEPDLAEFDAEGEDGWGEATKAPAKRSGAPESAPPPPGAIRIDDGGLLVKMLSSQGMELEVDMIMSKTVFHAVRQQEGAGLKGSVVYLDSSAQTVDADIWRFLQVVGEVIGLRHGKYKDALIQLDKRKEAEAGILGWRPT